MAFAAHMVVITLIIDTLLHPKEGTRRGGGGGGEGYRKQSTNINTMENGSHVSLSQ